MILSIIISLVLLYTLSAISSASQFGGSPLLNFILMSMAAISTDYYLVGSLSSTTALIFLLLFGGSLPIIISNYKNGPKVMYDLVAVVVPAAASGAVFGALLRNFLSELFIALFMAFIFVFMIYHLYRNPIVKNQHINKQQNSQSQQIIQLKSINVPLLQQQPHHTEPEPNPQLQKILQQQQNKLPKSKMKIVVFVLLYTAAILTVKRASADQLYQIDPTIQIPQNFAGNVTKNYYGNESDTYQIVKSTGSYIYIDTDATYSWDGLSSCILGSLALLVVHFTLSYLSSKSAAIQIAQTDSQKQKYGYVFTSQSDKMSSSKMWGCMIWGFCAGIVMAVFGIGSSIALVGALMRMGVGYGSAVSTSSFVTFILSIVVAFLSWSTGLYSRLSLIFAIIVVVVSAFTTILAKFLIGKFYPHFEFSLQQKEGQQARQKMVKNIYIASLTALLLYILVGLIDGGDAFTSFGSFC